MTTMYLKQLQPLENKLHDGPFKVASNERIKLPREWLNGRPIESVYLYVTGDGDLLVSVTDYTKQP